MEIVRYWTMMVLKVIPIHLDLKKNANNLLTCVFYEQVLYYYYYYASTVIITYNSVYTLSVNAFGESLQV